MDMVGMGMGTDMGMVMDMVILIVDTVPRIISTAIIPTSRRIAIIE